MDVQFKDSYLESLFQGIPFKGKPRFSTEVVSKFKKTVLTLMQVENSSKHGQLRGLNFEKIKESGKYSVSVDQQYRIIFKIEKEKITLLEIVIIEELLKHYK